MVDYMSDKVCKEIQDSEIGLRDNRWNFIIKNIPDILNYHTVLYIGANKLRHWFLDKFENEFYLIDILEIFPKNVEWLKAQNKYIEIFEGDIREFEFTKKYDVIFWYHGIEHVYKDDFANCLNKIKQNINHLAVFGCPYGNYRHDAIYGNQNERHIEAWYPEDLEKLGLKTVTSGLKDSGGESDLISWVQK